MDGFCLNCFSNRGEYAVCPYCGYLADTLPVEGYILSPGVRIWGRYLIGTLLGMGGFGITYRAWDTRLNTMVAIKEFFPHSLVSRAPNEGKVRVFSGEKQTSYSQQLARFIDEAKNLAKFTGDSHVVNVLDFFEENNTAYIVMEFLDGVTLKEFMEQSGGFLPFQQALEIGKDLLEALSSIHKKGIIHRDISPDNIFILKDGSMKVLDFGAARFVSNEGSQLTQGVVVKKGYAPPEQYRNNMKQGVWTDIYAAGATLYKMATGITPEESIERSEKDALQRPSLTGTIVEASFDKTVMKAMALRPELRFKSAEAMLAALLNHTVIDFPEEELKKIKKRNRIFMACSTLLVIIAAGLIVWRTSNTTIVIKSGPSLADMEILPDTITVMVNVSYDEDNVEANQYSQLADAFMEKYPEHKVEIVHATNDMGEDEEFRNQFLTSESPTVFEGYMSNIDYWDIPILADLTPLYNSLNMEEFVLLEDYLEEEINDDKEITDIPLGFYFQAAYFDEAQAVESGITIPNSISSMTEIEEWERAEPGTVALDGQHLEMLIDIFTPEIEMDKDIDKMVKYVGDWAEMHQQGYYTNRIDTMEYKYDEFLVQFGDTGTYTIQYMNERFSPPAIVPLLRDGTIPCNTTAFYSVSSKVSENQQNVGMLFLHFALTEYGQNILHVQNDGENPLNRKAILSYTQNYPQLEFLNGEFKDQLVYQEYHWGTIFENLYDVMDYEGGRAEAEAYVLEVYEERMAE